jgi:hypothetical protein
MATEVTRQYLLDYLVDEFRSYPEVRIRNLPHDKDTGVTVRTEAREYFFEFDWVEGMQLDQVEKLVRSIKDVLPPR